MKATTRGGLDLPADVKDTGMVRKNHLLVIGIDAYSNGIRPLNNAVLDATAFRDLLLRKYQFEEGRTTALFNEAATKDNILNTFYGFAENLTAQDNLIIYFAGHGELNDITDRGYWLPADAREKSWGSFLSNNDIIDIFKAMKAHHIFAIVDSCFSGALFQRSGSVADEKQDRDPSRWLLTAGKKEPVPDGQPGDHSPFCNALLTYLDSHASSSLWVSELCGKVLRGVEFNSQNQSPRGEPLPNVGHYGGQFVFYPKGYVAPAQPAPTSTPTNKSETNRGGTVSPPPPPPPPPKEKTHFSDMAELKMDLKMKIAEDIEVFFTHFDKVFNAQSNRVVNSLIIQKGAYNRAKKDENAGTVSSEFVNRTYARIRHALTNMVDDLNESDIKEGKIKAA